ncbi:MAG TPA: NAD(+)/NADH kinase [Thermoplasmata archaeon]|nr:NAD(+)/NADH kinase [Thermoplasmata archaeon]
MKVGITANPGKPHALALVEKTVRLLGGRTDVVLARETREAMHADAADAPLEQLDADLLVAIGGDGTFLSAFQRSRLPILPVNAGTVGFLAEVDGDDEAALSAAIDRLVAGRYLVEDRMKLASEVGPVALPDATNEIVVHTSQVAKMRRFEISVDGRPVGRLQADGVILATPTGSTSYAMSAFGPILDPSVEGIVVTALAPFRAAQRALVIDPLRTVSVRLAKDGKDGVVVVDGQHEHRLENGRKVVAYRSPRPASFVRFGSRFFHQLHGKRILPWVEEPGDGDSRDNADLPAHP